MTADWVTHKSLCQRIFTATTLCGNATEVEVYATDTVDEVCKRITKLVNGSQCCSIVAKDLIKSSEVLYHCLYMKSVYKITEEATFLYRTCDEPTLTGNDVGKYSDAIFCENCEMWLNGPMQWQDHTIGKNIKKI